jgi:hypothetical protein
MLRVPFCLRKVGTGDIPRFGDSDANLSSERQGVPQREVLHLCKPCLVSTPLFLLLVKKFILQYYLLLEYASTV